MELPTYCSPARYTARYTLTLGTFTQLRQTHGVFDAVISSEVIEHLKPEDLLRYWEIHLGTLQPNVFIVTTPNRDFNAIFEFVERYSPGNGAMLHREGLPYRTRHDDHRFEYTRADFEETYQPPSRR
jgi:2-polyprenyl-3-methyl-5-hydroxy-6-metoxy-1,4-benzoquinol methylase